MKKMFFLLSITLLVTIFTSCKKQKIENTLPGVKEYFKCPVDTFSSQNTFVTISDGDKVYELHDLGAGKKFIKFTSGFPEEFIGEELLNEAAYDFFSKKINHRKILTASDWDNWIKRNRNEGFGYSLKNMGAFLLSPNEEGHFIATNQAFAAWAYCGPAVYWGNEFFSGTPSEWLPETGSYQIEIFCSLPIMDN